jgi:hypothetical protein
MGARQKLNQAYLNGALVIAAVVGAATESWAVFWLAALIAAGSSLYSGEIRPHGRRDKY